MTKNSVREYVSTLTQPESNNFTMSKTAYTKKLFQTKRASELISKVSSISNHSTRAKTPLNFVRFKNENIRHNIQVARRGNTPMAMRDFGAG